METESGTASVSSQSSSKTITGKGRRQRLAAKKFTTTSPSAPSRPGLGVRRRVELVIHEQRGMDPLPDIFVNPKLLPGLEPGIILRITSVIPGAQQLVLPIESQENLKSRVDLSIKKTVVDLFRLHNRTEVVVEIISGESVTLDYVELLFQDQYISRGDMWRLKQDLCKQCVYVTQEITAFGLRAHINELLISNINVGSGVIGENTRFVFRSKSARLTWLIQISQELWDCADDGQLYVEKIVSGLMKVILEQWKLLRANHNLTIILFSRTFFDGVECSEFESELFRQDMDNRLFQDVFKVVVDSETVHDGDGGWERFQTLLKTEINEFSSLVQWGVPDSRTGLIGMPSSAAEGNVLEAINMSLNVYEKHYWDRDCLRTGLGIVVFTAGNGVIKVDGDLAQLTRERLVDNGVGCDIISVGRRPLHVAPIFIIKSSEGKTRFDTPKQWLLTKYFDHQSYHRTSLDQRLGFLRESRHPFNPLPWCQMFPDDQFLRPILFRDADEYENRKKADFVVPDGRRPPLGAPSELVCVRDPQIFIKHDLKKFDVNERSNFCKKPHKVVSSVSVQDFSHVKDDLQFTSPDDYRRTGSKSPILHSESHSALDALDGGSSSHTGSPESLLASRGPGELGKLVRSRSFKLAFRRNPSSEFLKEAKLSDSPDWKSTGRLGDTDSFLRLSPPLDGSYVAEEEEESTNSIAIFAKAPVTNPFKPQLYPSTPSSNRRRWSHLLPTFDLENDPLDELNMKSLAIPAILPLTCDYFPSSLERSQQFQKYPSSKFCSECEVISIRYLYLKEKPPAFKTLGVS